jgi:hypothetical protein
MVTDKNGGIIVQNVGINKMEIICQHKYRDDIMKESGIWYPIKVCTKCGDWG